MNYFRIRSKDLTAHNYLCHVMTNQPSEQNADKSGTLLKECDAMPALIREKVSKRFEEQSKYFMKVEELYALVTRSVKELEALHQQPAEKQTLSNVIAFTQPEKKESKSEPAGKDNSPSQTHEPRIIGMEKMLGDEMTVPHLLLWITEVMRYLTKVKEVFDNSKQTFNTEYNEVRTQGKFETERILLATLDQMEHPGRVKNPNFLADLKKGGISRFEEGFKDYINMLGLQQDVTDEAAIITEKGLSQYNIMESTINSIYQIIAKTYQQVMKNATDDVEQGTNSSQTNTQLLIMVGVFVEQKNMLEAFRFHQHLLTELLLNLNYISIVQQGVRMRVFILNASMLHRIFGADIPLK